MYGTLEFGELEARIIDTPDFQRLRGIRQMSFTNLVYPGANHTRFEHSLGTAHLSGLMARKLGLDADTTAKVKLYGLLHDIGHVAFSHEGEDVLARHIGDHEKIGKQRITRGEIADILSKSYDPKEIAGLGKRKEGGIVYSDLGSDRMDYLKRDAMNTGVAYGIIDTDRIVHTLSMDGGGLAISEGGLTAAESLLIARFMMFSAVYMHRTVRIATAMLYRAIALAIADGTVEPGAFAGMGDEEAMAAMAASPGAGKYVSGLRQRRLYKEAFSVDASGRDEAQAAALGKRLSSRFGTDIIVDYPHQFWKPVDFNVLTASGPVPITKLSGLVATLEESERKRRRMLVLCPAADRGRVGTELQNSGL